MIIWAVVWLAYALEFLLVALGWFWVGSGKVLPMLETISLAFFIQKALSQKVLNQSEKDLPSNSKARVAILSDEKMHVIATKLQGAMTDDKLFLQNNLSLNKLSESIFETENHISETLSQCLNTNFFNLLIVTELKRLNGR